MLLVNDRPKFNKELKQPNIQHITREIRLLYDTSSLSPFKVIVSHKYPYKGYTLLIHRKIYTLTARQFINLHIKLDHKITQTGYYSDCEHKSGTYYQAYIYTR
jgi:hypothetical protein